MSPRTMLTHTLLIIISLALTGCFSPPYNNFVDDKRKLTNMGTGAGVGATIGAIAGSVGGSAGLGAVVGGVAGTAYAYQQTMPPRIIKNLEKQNIQFIKYGDTQTLVVPTDQYFYFDNGRINDLAYPGLNNIVRLLKFYPQTPIYVAGFTDDVGSRKHKNKLSQARAEAMVTFLWANGIESARLHPEGYGAKHPVGDNQWIRGSAYNRRLEIQWMTAPSKHRLAFLSKTK